jgi:hypothetical protein
VSVIVDQERGPYLTSWCGTQGIVPTLVEPLEQRDQRVICRNRAHFGSILQYVHDIVEQRRVLTRQLFVLDCALISMLADCAWTE